MVNHSSTTVSTDPDSDGVLLETIKDRGQEEAQDSTNLQTIDLKCGVDSGKNISEERTSSSSVRKHGRFTEKWMTLIEKIKEPPMRALLAVTNHAVTHPMSYVVSILIFSILLLVIGFLTNFNLDVDEDVLWTPFNSKPVQHGDWIDEDSGFPVEPRTFQIFVHADGQQVLSLEGTRRIFEAVDVVRSTKGYPELCALSKNTNELNSNGDVTCRISSVMKFWNNSLDVFQATVASDADAIVAMSAVRYPDGEPVDRQSILGNAQPLLRDYEENVDVPDDYILTYAQSYFASIELPPSDDEAESFESDAIDNILDLQDRWMSEEGNRFRVEFFANRSFSDEFTRAINKDIPLLPVVFVIMSVFCCIVFAKRNKVRSQALLGFGAVVTVLLSIMTGYGLLFVIGVPFTSLTQIFPFIMFGIGLDDAFIIHGAYDRTDPRKDAVDRIKDTMNDVGASIMITTLTTVAAFSLGCSSNIPSVYWFCLYAFPCVLIDFIYQVTFFVALMVFDDRRMKANRYDCAVCCKLKKGGAATEEEEANDSTSKGRLVERGMMRYADMLLKPWVKASVLVVFAIILGLLAFSTTKLKQSFDFTDMVPEDSYLQTFFEAYDDYSENLGIQPGVYFRDVDFSDLDIQAAMNKTVQDLVDLKWISNPPTFFWLWDFQEFLDKNPDLKEQAFSSQIELFLDDPVYNALYAEDIVRNENGDMTASRTWVSMDQVDSYEVEDQIDALLDQREVIKDQPINEGRSDWAFFTFDGNYYIWEFYSVAVDELFLSTILGVVAVGVIALISIPHWSGALFVTPMVAVIYVDLLGFVQLAGLHINAVTYIGLIMSIGLMVDYVMHVVVKYVESDVQDREGKVRDVLGTMGASVLIGGTSTLLGVIPLVFSTSEIFWTIFIVFLGLVVFGLAHGVILMPVILSLIGPTTCVRKESSDGDVIGKQDELGVTVIDA